MDLRKLMNRENFTLNAEQRAEVAKLLAARNFSGLINYVLECDRDFDNILPQMRVASVLELLHEAHYEIKAVAPTVGKLSEYKIKTGEICTQAQNTKEISTSLMPYLDAATDQGYEACLKETQALATAMGVFDEFLKHYLGGFRFALRFSTRENPAGEYTYYVDQEELAATLIDSFDLDPQKLMRGIEGYISDAIKEDDSNYEPEKITCFSESYIELAEDNLTRLQERHPEFSTKHDEELESLEISLKTVREEYLGLKTKLQCRHGLGEAFTAEVAKSSKNIKKHLKSAQTVSARLIGILKNSQKQSKERN